MAFKIFALGCSKFIAFVCDVKHSLDQLGPHFERTQRLDYVSALCVEIRMRNIFNVYEQVGSLRVSKRRFKRGKQIERQIGNEADCISEQNFRF